MPKCKFCGRTIPKSDKDLSNNLSDSQKYIELFYTATDRIVNEKFNF